MGRLIERTRLFIEEAIALEQQAPQLWHEINESIQWLDGIFYALCAAYILLAAAALMQIIRIQLRVPEYGWTSQKVFHLMNLIFDLLRAVIFGFHKYLFAFKPRGFAVHVLLDLPGTLFLSTYTLIVVFWAQIYYQARSSSSTETLRPHYCIINGLIYLIQLLLWFNMWLVDESSAAEEMTKLIWAFKLFVAFISISAAMSFLIYGVSLFLLLKQFPTDFQDNGKMLHEIRCVTVICFTCFCIKCFMGAFVEYSLDVMKHPILNLFYYMLGEILPSGLVLFILRELPPKRKPCLYCTA